MDRAVLASIGLAAAVVFLVTPAHAQKPPRACSLLEVAEIESALGAKAKRKPSSDVQSIPGMAVDTCAVPIAMPSKSGGGGVDISIITGLPKDAGDGIRMRHEATAREPQWKTPGARLEQKTVGDAVCIMHGRPGVIGHTICTIPRGKGYVEVDVKAPVEALVAIDVVRALAQKAASRL